MKGRSIILGQLDGREAAALMVDGRLEDLFVAPKGNTGYPEPPVPGSIYRAIADRPMKGQGGLFLSTPDGQVFLRQIKGVGGGQPLLVQVTGHAEPGKAAPVSTRLMFKSRYVILTPGAPGRNVSRSIRDPDRRAELTALSADVDEIENCGLILRSASGEADNEAVLDDIISMSQVAEAVLTDTGSEAALLLEGDPPHALAWREWPEPAEVIDKPGAFSQCGVTEALDAARNPVQPLRGGGSMIVEPTRALIAVDVNTGRDTSPASSLKANLACARELPRILRLRGLGGQITMDFAPMPKKDRRAVESALRAAFKTDPVETTLAGWTPLGHFELQRARARAPL